MGCSLCPRQCGVERARGERGFCGAPAELRVARAALHPFEEPCISGERGSGTVFFAGCSLGCIFCQNNAIHSPGAGRAVSEDELGRLFLSLQEKGAHNINLVTPTHYADRIARVLEWVRGELKIPVVYNCGGYERPETVRVFEGLVDVYLPDFKYVSRELSAAYSGAPDYAEFATASLLEMVRQAGKACFDQDGMMVRGVMVRHLVLPGCRKDSMSVLDRIAEVVGVDRVRLSLMRQYTPDFAPETAPKNLKRRLTSFEYESVAEHALSLGFEGYFQEAEAANAVYTPDFSRMELPKI